jgi:hypothetical protein
MTKKSSCSAAYADCRPDARGEHLVERDHRFARARASPRRVPQLLLSPYWSSICTYDAPCLCICRHVSSTAEARCRSPVSTSRRSATQGVSRIERCEPRRLFHRIDRARDLVAQDEAEVGQPAVGRAQEPGNERDEAADEVRHGARAFELVQRVMQEACFRAVRDADDDEDAAVAVFDEPAQRAPLGSKVEFRGGVSSS